jgi:signal recognition particle GTPase
MMADIGSATTAEILDDLRAVAREDELDPEDVKSVLRGKLIEVLSVKDRSIKLSRSVDPEEAKVRGGTVDLWWRGR